MAGYSTALRNTRSDALTAAAGSAATLKFYTGPAPATGGSVGGLTLLGTLVCGSPFAPSSAVGVLTPNTIAAVNAVASGTIAFARLATSGGTFVADFTVGTSGADINLATVVATSGLPITITGGTITEGNP